MDSEAKIADALHFALRGRRQIAPGARASTYFGRSRDTAAFEQGMDHWCLDGYDETRIHLVIRGVTGRPQTYRSSTDLQSCPQTYKVVHRLTGPYTDLQGRPQTCRVVHRLIRSSMSRRYHVPSYAQYGDRLTFFLHHQHVLSRILFSFRLAETKLLTTPYSIPVPKDSKCVF